MLFSSFAFIFAFLPVTVIGYLVIGAYQRRWAAAWLVAASMVFYVYWDLHYLPLLLFSAVGNFVFGRLLALAPEAALGRRRLLLTAAVAFNLGLLGYYKYTNFFVENFETLSGIDLAVGNVVLPLGISFFTFTQLAFIVDVYRREASEPNFLQYLLFVSYFPHLIAGPILHHSEMMPQFARLNATRFDLGNFRVGCVIFIIGLFKKTVLADSVAVYANAVFDAAKLGKVFSVGDAWGGALSYTFQLYFDFSGYCDMAIGCSLMFGVALPLNFASPYKSTSIVEFWRRWHMTLSRFLRDYLYIALGGNRKGDVRRYVNLFATMLLGGLWHGAGWNFIIWGALHGLYLVINHAFGAFRARLGFVGSSRLGIVAAWLVTFLAVVVGWVFFRAETLPAAMHVLGGMANLSPCALPDAIADCAAESTRFQMPQADTNLMWLWCAILAVISLAAPNTQEIMGYAPAAMHGKRPETPTAPEPAPITFRPSSAWAAYAGVLFAAALACLPQPTSFLYFNF